MHRHTSLCLVAAVLSASTSYSEERRPRDLIEIRAKDRLNKIDLARLPPLLRIEENADSVTASLNVRYNFGGTKAERNAIVANAQDSFDFRSNFVGIRSGQVLPLYGHRYRAEIDTSDRMLRLRRIKDDEKGVAKLLFGNSFSIPLGCMGYLRGCKNHVVRIDPGREGGAGPTATIHPTCGAPRIDLLPPKEEWTQTVAKGDKLLLPGAAHVVRNVVPPDPRTGVVGWVDSTPSPPPTIRGGKGLSPLRSRW